MRGDGGEGRDRGRSDYYVGVEAFFFFGSSKLGKSVFTPRLILLLVLGKAR